VKAPPAEAFPQWPTGWYVAARSAEVGSKPLGIDLFGGRLVCYRTTTGEPVVMDARCWHMGADLSAGSLEGDQVVCPFHGWRYGPSGQCEHTPAQPDNPACARQQTYQTVERSDRLFVFPSAEAAYPLPFFGEVEPADLIAAPTFEFVVNCPWWLIGTNAFDIQHFAAAHDRRLLGEPVLESPHPSARRIVTMLQVCGTNWRDRLTRVFAGPRVTMDVTVWSGTLAFVIARFHSTRSGGGPTSYGMTEIRPAGSPADKRSLVRVTIFRSRRLGLQALDWIDVRIKRHFVRSFLQTDTVSLDGSRYDSDHLIEADLQMINYLRWLVVASGGDLTRKERQ
jgi:phenylpropionate dioxygenase-like ring-hydroxylating dioxygenase large terminal subunit